MARYSIYVSDNEEEKLLQFMKSRKISKKSQAIKSCVEIVLNSFEYESSFRDISNKLNRILYRQKLSSLLLEQLFANMGFPLNEKIEDDKQLENFYKSHNKFLERFD